MSLSIFKQHSKIEAFFSQKPLVAESYIPQLCREAEATGFVVKAGLVHGKRIAAIDESHLNGDGPGFERDGNFIKVPETDGLITKLPDVALVTTHGDCIPVFAYDPVKNVIGVAHAGWKGTKLGIAGELVNEMARVYGCNPSDIEAFVGPGIGACCFEVRDDVRRAFSDDLPWFSGYIRQKDEEHSLIDLKGINRRFLELAGCTKIQVSPDCTVCRENLYWSYRRGGDMQRMISYMRIKG